MSINITTRTSNLTNIFSISCNRKIADYTFYLFTSMVPNDKSVYDYHKIEFHLVLYNRSFSHNELVNA